MLIINYLKYVSVNFYRTKFVLYILLTRTLNYLNISITNT